jgi:hypothetical protein
MRDWGHARTVVPLLLLASPLLPPMAAHAQNLDVTGSWAITMQTLPRPSAPPVRAAVPASCVFQGLAGDTQTGSSFSGNIAVALQSGPASCPSSMSAPMSGNVTGNQLTMGVVMGGGALGQASFTGTVTPAPAGTRSATRPAAPVNPGSTITGTFSVTSGPFSGTGGTWSATKQATAAPGIPALGARGLAALALLLVIAAVWLLRRKLVHDRLPAG